jgi:hypothetical protein
MTVDDAIREFTSLCEKVFGNPRHFHYHGPLFWPRHKYDYKVLEAAFTEVVERHARRGSDRVGNAKFNSPIRMCKT